MALTLSELDFFHDHGYLVRKGVYGSEDLAPIKAAIDALIDEEVAALAADGVRLDGCRDVGFDRRLALLRSQAPPEAFQRIVLRLTGKGGGGFSGPAMFGMLTHEPLLDCIESLVGPTIVGSSVHRIRPKLPAYDRGEVPWHQDSGYMLAHCDRYLIVTCWIPLVDATIDNGCLYVLPGAHRKGILRHHTGGHAGFLEIAPEDLPTCNPVAMEMPAGAVLFMTNLTPHASYSNRTDRIRWSVDLRYQGADAPSNVGEDPAAYVPERDPVTMACYPPEADFVIRDPSRPEREVRTVEAFQELRQRYEEARPWSPGRGWTPMAERDDVGG